MRWFQIDSCFNHRLKVVWFPQHLAGALANKLADFQGGPEELLHSFKPEWAGCRLVAAHFDDHHLFWRFVVSHPNFEPVWPGALPPDYEITEGDLENLQEKIGNSTQV